MSKRRFWCAFCAAIARFSFDYVPMCDDHFMRLQLALAAEWTD